MKFTFNNETFVVNANANDLSPSTFRSALSGLPNIGKVSVEKHNIDHNGSAKYTITFLRWPLHPHENNIYFHDGNPPIESFDCEIVDGHHKRVPGMNCIIQDIVSSNIEKYVYCSKNGKCDHSSGECSCNPGWSGVACQHNTYGDDIEQYYATNDMFSGNVLKLEVAREPSKSFNFLKAISNTSSEISTLSGDGSLTLHQGRLNVSSGTSFFGSSMYVNNTDSMSPGITVESGGDILSLVTGSSTKIPTMIQMKTENTASNDFKFIESFTGIDKKYVFGVTGNGLVETSQGILVHGNDILDHENDPSPKIITPKLKVGTGGIELLKGQINMKEGAGIQISSGGSINIEDGMSSFSSDLSSTLLLQRNFSKGVTNLPNPATLVISHLEKGVAPFVAFKTGNKSIFSVEASGETKVCGGIDVDNGGITVNSGGINVNSGGINVHGGLTIKSGELKFSNNTHGISFLGQNGIKSVVSGITASSFTAHATDKSYKGSVMTLNGPQSEEDSFLFLQMNVVAEDSMDGKDESTVYSIMSSGTVTSRGSMYVDRDISVGGFLDVNGAMRMKKKVFKADNEIILSIDSMYSFLEIVDNGLKTSNNLIIKGPVEEGQLLLVKNSDDDPLIGSLGYVPAKSTVFFISGSGPDEWTDVTTVQTQRRELIGVTQLQASNDIDIGKHMFTSEDLVVKSKGDMDHYGQLAYFGKGGKLMGEKGIKIRKPSTNIPEGGVQFSGFAADYFIGDAIDFKGATIANAAMTNTTFDILDHITVKSLGVLSEKSNKGGGIRMAVVNEKGSVSTVSKAVWDDKRDIFKVPSISTTDKISGLKIHSNVDMMLHKLSNFEIERNSTLRYLNFNDGWISNTILTNVTARDLKLGSVDVHSIKITSLSSQSKNQLSFIVNSDKNGVITSKSLYESDEGGLVITKRSIFESSVDLDGNKVTNAIISEGSIIHGSDIDINVNEIIVNSFTLSSMKRKNVIGHRSLALFDDKGTLENSNIFVSPQGWVSSMKVSGSLDFRMEGFQDENTDDNSDYQGQILNAIIHGGRIESLESLSVVGESILDGNMNIQGETTIEGNLVVSGSVLGSGPYIDVSDERLKKNIRSLSEGLDESILENLLKLNGVVYELDAENVANALGTKNIRGFTTSDEDRHGSRTRIKFNDDTQIGFIAQDVEKVFPQLVQTDINGYKGINYARFVPLITESIKEMNENVYSLSNKFASLQKENQDLKRMIQELRMDIYKNCRN